MASLEKNLSESLLWSEAKAILQKLHKNGFEAVLAGGAVRDALLRRPVKDFDIAASASPQETRALFPRSQTQGQRFGVLSLPASKNRLKSAEALKGRFFEIASFRKDGPYKDGRRPLFVRPASIEEDALRRDFTVNALFYDIRAGGRILDFTGGMEDLKARCIRAVGQPRQRFSEDRLRPLRAWRFSLVLDFSVEERTAGAVRRFAPDVFQVSSERIFEELSKALSSSPAGKAALALKEFGFLEVLFASKKALWDPLLFWRREFFKTPAADLALAMSILGLPFFYADPDGFAGLLRRSLKAPAKLAQRAASFIRGARLLISPQGPFVEKMEALAALARPLADLALAAAPFAKSSLAEREIEALFHAFEARKAKSGALPPPLIKGEDLILQGFAPSQALGQAKKRAFALQIERNISSKKALLKALLEEEKKA